MAPGCCQARRRGSLLPGQVGLWQVGIPTNRSNGLQVALDLDCLKLLLPCRSSSCGLVISISKLRRLLSLRARHSFSSAVVEAARGRPRPIIAAPRFGNQVPARRNGASGQGHPGGAGSLGCPVPWQSARRDSLIQKQLTVESHRAKDLPSRAAVGHAALEGRVHRSRSDDK